MTTVGDRVRELRQEQGLSLRALAERSGLTPTGVSLIEQGQRTPSASTMEKLAFGLGVAPGELFPKEVAPPSSAGEARRSLFASWAEYVDKLSSIASHTLNMLPKQPTAEEWDRGREVLELLLTTAGAAFESMEREDVAGKLVRTIEAIDRGGDVPDEERRAAIHLNVAVRYFMLGMSPQIRRWVLREDEADQLDKVGHWAPEWQEEHKQQINEWATPFNIEAVT